MNRTLMRGMFAIGLLNLVAARSGAQEPTNYVSATVRHFLEAGLQEANYGHWGLAVDDFIAADDDNPDLPQVWFNLALAESNLPGYELRAAALMKAFLLQQPNSPQREAINKLRQRLEAAAREHIRLILAGLMGPAEYNIRMFSCDSDQALANIARAQIRAGLYEDARATIARKKPPCAGDHSDDKGLDSASFAAAATQVDGSVIRELHSIGRNGFEFEGPGYKVPGGWPACYLEVPGSERNRHGTDLELPACINAAKTDYRDNRPQADYATLAKMLGLANTLSDVLNLVN